MAEETVFRLDARDFLSALNQMTEAMAKYDNAAFASDKSSKQFSDTIDRIVDSAKRLNNTRFSFAEAIFRDTDHLKNYAVNVKKAIDGIATEVTKINSRNFKQKTDELLEQLAALQKESGISLRSFKANLIALQDSIKDLGGTVPRKAVDDLKNLVHSFEAELMRKPQQTALAASIKQANEQIKTAQNALILSLRGHRSDVEQEMKKVQSAITKLQPSRGAVDTTSEMRAILQTRFNTLKTESDRIAREIEANQGSKTKGFYAGGPRSKFTEDDQRQTMAKQQVTLEQIADTELTVEKRKRQVLLESERQATEDLRAEHLRRENDRIAAQKTEEQYEREHAAAKKENAARDAEIERKEHTRRGYDILEKQKQEKQYERAHTEAKKENAARDAEIERKEHTRRGYDILEKQKQEKQYERDHIEAKKENAARDAAYDRDRITAYKENANIDAKIQRSASFSRISKDLTDQVATALHPNAVLTAQQAGRLQKQIIQVAMLGSRGLESPETRDAHNAAYNILKGMVDQVNKPYVDQEKHKAVYDESKRKHEAFAAAQLSREVAQTEALTHEISKRIRIIAELEAKGEHERAKEQQQALKVYIDRINREGQAHVNKTAEVYSNLLKDPYFSKLTSMPGWQSAQPAIALKTLAEAAVRAKIETKDLMVLLNQLRSGKLNFAVDVGQTHPELVTSLAQLQKSLIAAKAEANDTGASMLRFSNLVVARVVTHAFYGLTTAMRSSHQAALDLSRGLGEIQTITQQLPQSTETWQKSVMSISEGYGFAVKDVTEGLYQTISNQIGQGQQAVDFMKQVAPFALATKSTVAQSINLLSAALNSFQLDVGQTEQIAAKMFQTINLGRVRAEDMNETFGRAGMMVHQAGISLDEYLAMISLFTIHGVRFDQAMTYIINVIQKLVKPTKDMKEFFHTINVSSGEAALQVYGLGGIIKKMLEGTGGSLEGLAELTHEIRGTIGFSGLMSDWERLGVFQKRIAGSVGEYTNAVKIMTETTAVQWAKEAEIIKNTMISALSRIQAMIMNISKGMKDITGFSVGQTIAGTLPFIGAIGAFYAEQMAQVATGNAQLVKQGSFRGVMKPTGKMTTDSITGLLTQETKFMTDWGASAITLTSRAMIVSFALLAISKGLQIFTDKILEVSNPLKNATRDFDALNKVQSKTLEFYEANEGKATKQRIADYVKGKEAIINAEQSRLDAMKRQARDYTVLRKKEIEEQKSLTEKQISDIQQGLKQAQKYFDDFRVKTEHRKFQESMKDPYGNELSADQRYTLEKGYAQKQMAQAIDTINNAKTAEDMHLSQKQFEEAIQTMEQMQATANQAGMSSEEAKNMRDYATNVFQEAWAANETRLKDSVILEYKKKLEAATLALDGVNEQAERFLKTLENTNISISEYMDWQDAVSAGYTPLIEKESKHYELLKNIAELQDKINSQRAEAAQEVGSMNKDYEKGKNAITAVGNIGQYIANAGQGLQKIGPSAAWYLPIIDPKNPEYQQLKKLYTTFGGNSAYQQFVSQAQKGETIPSQLRGIVQDQLAFLNIEDLNSTLDIISSKANTAEGAKALTKISLAILANLENTIATSVSKYGSISWLQAIVGIKGTGLEQVLETLSSIRTIREGAKKATGGWVTGPNGIDKVPTWLTSGEYVVNARSANKFGPLLDRINYYSDGGSVEDYFHKRKKYEDELYWASSRVSSGGSASHLAHRISNDRRGEKPTDIQRAILASHSTQDQDVLDQRRFDRNALKTLRVTGTTGMFGRDRSEIVPVTVEKAIFSGYGPPQPQDISYLKDTINVRRSLDTWNSVDNRFGVRDNALVIRGTDAKYGQWTMAEVQAQHNVRDTLAKWKQPTLSSEQGLSLRQQSIQDKAYLYYIERAIKMQGKERLDRAVFEQGLRGFSNQMGANFAKTDVLMGQQRDIEQKIRTLEAQIAWNAGTQQVPVSLHYGETLNRLGYKMILLGNRRLFSKDGRKFFSMAPDSGQLVRYNAEGGHVGGPRGTDTIPAWLTPGEFVVNARAAAQYRDVLEDINNFSAAPRPSYALAPIYRNQGGSVGETTHVYYNNDVTIHNSSGSPAMDAHRLVQEINRQQHRGAARISRR